MNKLYRGAILILISASCYALMPIFAVYAYRGGTNVSTLLFLRFALAAIIFFIYIFTRIDKITFNRSGVRSSLLLGAVLLTLQSILYFESLKYIPTSLQALLFYTYPIFVTLLSFIVYKERPNIRLIASIALSMFGLGLVLGTSFETINFLGALLVLGAAAVYSVYMTVSNHIVKNTTPVVMSAFVTLSASVMLLIIGLSTNTLVFTFDKSAWLPILGIVLFSTLISLVTLFRGIELLGPARAAILSMVEPLVTIIISCILFHDKLDPWQWLGGIMVLGGALMIVISKQKGHESPAQ